MLGEQIRKDQDCSAYFSENPFSSIHRDERLVGIRSRDGINIFSLVLNFLVFFRAQQLSKSTMASEGLALTLPEFSFF